METISRLDRRVGTVFRRSGVAAVIELLPGTLVAGTYRIDARLGRGAFGAVYRAQHRFIGRVALKLIAYSTPQDLERIASEGGRHARLSHPNITRVFDVNTTEVLDTSALYIASEYMALGDLDRYLETKQRMPISDVIRLADDVLAALTYAHSLSTPLLHRDLKPANILLCGDSSLTFKVADFGVSAEVSAAIGVSQAAGTVVFQPPECAFGPYLVQSDLYGAALIIYRALTGTYPFAQMLTINAAERRDGQPVRPSLFRMECDDAIDSVMLRSLDPDPFLRYPSASDFRTEILGVLNGPARP